MCETCTPAVRALMNSSAAISRLGLAPGDVLEDLELALPADEDPARERPRHGGSMAACGAAL
jgi:hypothetical protein